MLIPLTLLPSLWLYFDIILCLLKGTFGFWPQLTAQIYKGATNWKIIGIGNDPTLRIPLALL